MEAEPACACELLASGRVCRVGHCRHGTVHLTLGALTLRVTPEQLEDLAATLALARRRLEAGLAGSGRPVDRLLC